LIEAFRPEALVAVEPSIGLPHGSRAEAAGHGAAVLLAGDEARRNEDVDMLEDRRQRHRQRRRKIAHRQALGLAEPCNQRAAGRIGKRREGQIEAFRLIVNHLVKYRRKRRPVKPALSSLSL
jgi:hypothetical protein